MEKWTSRQNGITDKHTKRLTNGHTNIHIIRQIYKKGDWQTERHTKNTNQKLVVKGTIWKTDRDINRQIYKHTQTNGQIDTHETDKRIKDSETEKNGKQETEDPVRIAQLVPH